MGYPDREEIIKTTYERKTLAEAFNNTQWAEAIDRDYNAIIKKSIGLCTPESWEIVPLPFKSKPLRRFIEFGRLKFAPILQLINSSSISKAQCWLAGFAAKWLVVHSIYTVVNGKFIKFIISNLVLCSPSPPSSALQPKSGALRHRPREERETNAGIRRNQSRWRQGNKIWCPSFAICCSRVWMWYGNYTALWWLRTSNTCSSCTP